MQKGLSSSSSSTACSFSINESRALEGREGTPDWEGGAGGPIGTASTLKCLGFLKSEKRNARINFTYLFSLRLKIHNNEIEVQS